MTLVEVLVSVGIFSFIIVGVTALFAALWKMNEFTLKMGADSQQASYALTEIIDMIRFARQADNGAYPVISAEENQLIIYTDADGDDETERVRFFRQGDQIKKGVINPSGIAPVVYNPDNEQIETILFNVVDNPDSSPFLEYFDAANAKLNAPVSSADVRMVRVAVSVDEDLDKPPAPVSMVSFASIRNLREQ